MPYSFAAGACDTNQIKAWLLRRLAEKAITPDDAKMLDAMGGRIDDWLTAVLRLGRPISVRARISIVWACAGLPLEALEDSNPGGKRFTLRGVLCDAGPIYQWMFQLYQQKYLTATDIADLQGRYANLMDGWLLRLLYRGTPPAIVASVFFACPYAQSPIFDGTLVTYPESGGRVWVMVNGSRREIVQLQTPGDVFAACGYRSGDIKLYPKAQVEGYPVGPNIFSRDDCPYGNPPPISAAPVPIGTGPRGGLDPVVQAIKDYFNPVGLNDPNGWITATCVACNESGLDPGNYNPSGATGLFQILQSHCGNCDLFDTVNNIRWANNLIEGRIRAGQDPWADWIQTIGPCRTLSTALRHLAGRCGVDLSSYAVGGSAGSPPPQAVPRLPPRVPAPRPVRVPHKSPGQLKPAFGN